MFLLIPTRSVVLLEGIPSALAYLGADFDPLGRPELLVLHISVLDPQVLHLGRGQQGLDRGHDGSIGAGHDHGLAFAEAAIDQDNVNGRAQAWNGLDLQYGGLELLGEGQPFGQHGLGEVDQEAHQVAHSIPRMGRGGHHGDVGLGVGVLVEEGSVQPLLGYPGYDLRNDTVDIG